MSDDPVQYYADVDADGIQHGFYTSVDHTTLPTGAVSITEAQWQSWVSDQQQKLVDGDLVALPPPPPTADQAYTEKISAGIAITSSGNASLSATYPLDTASFALTGAIARDAASGLGLPHGLSTVPIADTDGTTHDFDEAGAIALYKAERDMISALGTQRDIQAGGGTPTWPPQSAVIP
jgi:hypothetical protein